MNAHQVAVPSLTEMGHRMKGMYLWTAKVWIMKKKLKMDISMVTMRVRMGCAALPMNKIRAIARQPCGETFT